jgi:hypothetical protein
VSRWTTAGLLALAALALAAALAILLTNEPPVLRGPGRGTSIEPEQDAS